MNENQRDRPGLKACLGEEQEVVVEGDLALSWYGLF
jgi:hypothetical protein